MKCFIGVRGGKRGLFMRKYTIEYINKCFKREGYKLLSDVYLGCKQKLDYICPKGHRHSISFGKWLEGRRCPYCDGQGKPTIDFIKDEFANEYFILLTKKYINSKQKLEFICPNNHTLYFFIYIFFRSCSFP